MTEKSETFRKLVELSGLSDIFAEPTIERACVRSGLDPATLTKLSVARMLPVLEEALAVYLEPGELSLAMKRIRALLPAGSGQFVLSLEGDEPESEDERTLPERVAAAMSQIRKNSR